MSLPPNSKEMLTFSPKLASIKVLPNPGEDSSPNFPRNLHNASEVFLRAGLIDHATRLHGCITTVLDVLENGPDGKTSHALGRGCVCWNCGYAGIPKNADECHVTEIDPAAVCGGCGEDDQTNFVRILIEGKEIPWMAVKEKVGGEKQKA
jgi:hypothetical protein